MALCPGDTTEWDDYHVRVGNFAPRPKEITSNEVHQMIIDAAEELNPFENKTLQQLNEIEDDEDEDFLTQFRKKRLQEMKENYQGKFGKVFIINKKEYVRQVNQASENGWVCLHLAQEYVPTSEKLTVVWKELAQRFPNIKFVEGVANKIVEYFPDGSVPAIFLYHKGECQHQIIGPSKVGGERVSADVVEWILAQKDILTTNLDEDPLLDDTKGFNYSSEEEDDENRDDGRGYSQLRIGNLKRHA